MSNSYKYTLTTTLSYETEGNYPVTIKVADSPLQGRCIVAKTFLFCRFHTSSVPIFRSKFVF